MSTDEDYVDAVAVAAVAAVATDIVVAATEITTSNINHQQCRL
jgi:hypothetical protein